MRKKIVAGNWKMNKTAQEAFVLATEVAELVKSSVSADVQVIMSTPALYLTGVNQVSNTSPVGIAGRVATTTGGLQIPFKGTVGIIRMYNTSLTSAQALQNFNANRSLYGL